MPRISRFYGITIAMYYSDHAPPHLHALYGGEEASLALSDLGVIEGRLPRRALRLVREWAGLHRAELEGCWRCAREGLPLDNIPGLE